VKDAEILQATEGFRRFAERADVDAFEGSLLISRLIDPDANLERVERDVEALARRVRAARSAGQSAEAALRQVLFDEESLAGDAESYDDPRNSSVADVLTRRRGMPITLSIIVLEVGRRAGLRLVGIGLPGHFVVGGPDLPTGRYLDPFDGGRLCDEESVAGRVSAIFGSAVELPPEAFLPDSPRSILIRVLFNLRRSYEKRDRFEEALTALAWAEALDPGEEAYLRERGLLLLKAGRTEEAVSTLDAYVESATGEDVEAVRKLIAIVREQALASDKSDAAPSERKVFTLDEARTLLPRVREITSDAVFKYARLGEGGGEIETERQTVVREWAREIASLGVEIKGLWLVDFDSGAGYYCWKYPEQSLEYFHGYDEGFAGRLPLQ
jgi:regulator of sirC expression with transglutaminase-like and TPR domain